MVNNITVHTLDLHYAWAGAQLRGAGGCSSTPQLKKGCPAFRPYPMTFLLMGVCDLGSHYYYLIIIFYIMRNALKSTYSNVEIQKTFRAKTSDPPLEGE